MLSESENRQLLSLVERIAERRAANREDAAEIAVMGCQCGGDPHARSCPISIAIEALGDVIVSGSGFQPIAEKATESRRKGDGKSTESRRQIALTAPEAQGKDIRHLAAPHTAKPVDPPSRAECIGCGRYARRPELIRHVPDCPTQARARPENPGA